MIKPEQIKLAVSSAEEPIVLRNIQLDWQIFRMTFDEWCSEMDKKNDSSPVSFTSGTTKHCDLPYWERFRTSDELTFNKFLARSKTEINKQRWHSHSYKDIDSWPDNLKDSISFEKLGFEKDVTKDILFWLGSEGANTPCHYDTYGFNIVVQVFGRKSWLLFPPKTRLTATRVPYEESSVYCKQNFYSPLDMGQFDVIDEHDTIYEVILEPGDILIIPPNYWHYVENLETSLAVNTWIPLAKHDSLARLGECFVRMQVDKITEDNEECTRHDLKTYIYNPNEVSSGPDMNLFNLFKPLADIVINYDESIDEYSSEKYCEDGKVIRNEFSDIFHKVKPITRRQLTEILLNHSLRHDSAMENRKTIDSHFHDVENVINAICHPSTVDSACKLYIQQIKNEVK